MARRPPVDELAAAMSVGHDGGRIVFEGTPADLIAARSTLTGEHLAAYVGSAIRNGLAPRVHR